MIRPQVDMVETDGALPDRAEVVTVGGGIIGVCAALDLAERGVRVVLCEEGRIFRCPFHSIVPERIDGFGRAKANRVRIPSSIEVSP